MENLDPQSPLEGHSFSFEPAKVQNSSLLEWQDNPGEDFHYTVVKDVIKDLKKPFGDEGVPNEVLKLLEQLWLTKLKNRDQEDPQVLDPVDSPNIRQLDGLYDSSSDSDVAKESDNSIDVDDSDDVDAENSDENADEADDEEPLGEDLDFFESLLILRFTLRFTFRFIVSILGLHFALHIVILCASDVSIMCFTLPFSLRSTLGSTQRSTPALRFS